MKTIEQAIQDRLEEKRLARERAAVKERERQKQIEALEKIVTDLFVNWVAEHYDIDIGSLDIRATHQNGDTFLIRIRFQSLGYIDLRNHISLIRSDAATYQLEVIALNAGIVWHAVHCGRAGNLYNDYSDLIDAAIYAMCGTSEPEEVAL